MTTDTTLAELRDMLARIVAHIDDRPRDVKAYRVCDLPDVLGVSRSGVDRLIANGDLPTVVYPSMKDRRVRAADVDDFLAGLEPEVAK